MAKRKRNSGGAANGADSIGQKRARPAADTAGSGAVVTAQSVSYGRVDPTYGQRSAIPGLDDLDYEDAGEGREGDVEYDVDVEALRYLRAVREEASGIPTLLVAPRTSRAKGSGAQDTDGDDEAQGVDRGIYEDGVGDSRGWYEDGAYTAAPGSPPLSGSVGSDGEHGGGRHAQDVYYESLIGRFEAMRRQLSQVPPRHAVERLDADHGCYMAASAKDYRKWKWRLQSTEPKPAQLAGMDKETVLRLLRIVGDTKGGVLGVENLIGEGGSADRRRVSAWVWGLLARLPGRGELVSEEVGVVRELGKRAVWVGVEMKGVDMTGLEEHMREGEQDEGNEYEEVVDVEVDGEDEHHNLDAFDESFLDGDEMRIRKQHHDTSSPEPQYSASFLDPPIIGPISPESLRGQSSQQVNSKTKDSISENQIREAQDEDETLSSARARLLARLKPHPTKQLPTTTSILSSLLSETDEAMSLPHTTAQEIKDHVTAMQKQLKKIVAARKQHKHHPLWPELEEKAGEMMPLIDLGKDEFEAKAGRDWAGSWGGDGDGGGEEEEEEEGRWSGEENENGDEEHAGEEDGEVVDDEQEVEQRTEEEEGPKEDRPSAIQGAKVLLDMIITIAGEVYGQRDLLEFREVWE